MLDSSAPYRRTSIRYLLRSPRFGNSLFSISTVFALLLLVHTLWFAWLSAARYPTIDFFTFWSVSQALAQKPSIPIYSLEGQREMASLAVNRAATSAASDLQRQATSMVLRLYDSRIDAISSPVLYTAVGLFSSGNFPVDQKHFLLVSMLCLFSAVLLLSNLLRLTALEIFLILSFLFWNYEPVSSDLSTGNVNSIQLFAITLFIFCMARSKPLLAGLAIGAVTAFKPTTLMVIAIAVVIAIVDRDYKQPLRMLAGCITAIAASVLVSSAYFGNPAIWLQFLRNLPQTLGGTYYSVESGNVSLSALLFGPSRGPSSVISLILLSALVWIFVSSRGPAVNPSPVTSSSPGAPFRMHVAFAAGGCGCAIMLLSSPLVWQHYYVLLLPLSAYLMSPLSRAPLHSQTEESKLEAALLRLLPFSPFVVLSLLFEQYVGKQNVRLLCGLIVLTALSTFLLSLYRLWHQRRAHFAQATG
jgi:Glycosyltransferase family 87